jgi:hypothetical protein
VPHQQGASHLQEQHKQPWQQPREQPQQQQQRQQQRQPQQHSAPLCGSASSASTGRPACSSSMGTPSAASHRTTVASSLLDTGMPLSSRQPVTGAVWWRRLLVHFRSSMPQSCAREGWGRGAGSGLVLVLVLVLMLG